MNCSDYQLLIPYRRTGDMLPEDVALVDRHLASCPKCSALVAPHAADVSIQKLIQTVDVPANLKATVVQAVAAEQSRAWLKSGLKAVGALVVIAGMFAASYGVYAVTRPRLDGEGVAIRNGWEADPSHLPNLIYDWLETEKLPTELPFEFDFSKYAAHGHEHYGRAYIPFIKFQSTQPTTSFAKLYFVRTADVDARQVIDGTQSSFCTVRLIPGPKGMTFVLVHTGSDPAPFVRPAVRNIN